jgi:hypothetical protein
LAHPICFDDTGEPPGLVGPAVLNFFISGSGSSSTLKNGTWKFQFFKKLIPALVPTLKIRPSSG